MSTHKGCASGCRRLARSVSIIKCLKNFFLVKFFITYQDRRRLLMAHLPRNTRRSSECTNEFPGLNTR